MEDLGHVPSAEASTRRMVDLGGHKLHRAARFMCDDGIIMMSRTQITLDPEVQRRARRRASDLGISLAEYVRRLVARDLGSAQRKAAPGLVFDLGSSGGSDIAKNKDAMIAEALGSRGRRR